MSCGNCGSGNTIYRTDEDNTYFECNNCGLIVVNGIETQKGVNQELIQLIDEFEQTKEELEKLIPNDADECSCKNDYGSYERIHHGKFYDEIWKYCLRCGGAKNLVVNR